MTITPNPAPTRSTSIHSEPPLPPAVWAGLSARAMAMIYLIVCLSPVLLGGLSQSVSPHRWETFGTALGLAGSIAMMVQLLISDRV